MHFLTFLRRNDKFPGLGISTHRFSLRRLLQQVVLDGIELDANAASIGKVPFDF